MRFSCEGCGGEPLVLTRSWRLITVDPAAGARELDAWTKVREAPADEWHANLSGPWAKHTDVY